MRLYLLYRDNGQVVSYSEYQPDFGQYGCCEMLSFDVTEQKLQEIKEAESVYIKDGQLIINPFADKIHHEKVTQLIEKIKNKKASQADITEALSYILEKVL